MNLSQDKWVESIKSSDNCIVLDVRTKEEFDEGYIKNSINLNIYDSQSFLDGVNKFEKNYSIHVYCRSGARSFQACELMTQFGFKNVYNLEGGMIEWKGDVIKN